MSTRSGLGTAYTSNCLFGLVVLLVFDVQLPDFVPEAVLIEEVVEGKRLEVCFLVEGDKLLDDSRGLFNEGWPGFVA